MNISKDQWTQIARALLVAALAIAGILGYDIAIVQPREAAIAARAEPLTRAASHFTEIEAEHLASTDDGTIADDFTIGDDLIGTGLINWEANEENIGLPSVISTTVAYTPTSGTIATVGASELWLVHAVYANVTADWDTAGNNDATLNIGDGNDADGLLDLDDAELQAADTEGTGAPAGWQGFMSTDARGAYLANGHGFIYGATDTIDYACGGTAADAGTATIYVVYTRVY